MLSIGRVDSSGSANPNGSSLDLHQPNVEDRGVGPNGLEDLFGNHFVDGQDADRFAAGRLAADFVAGDVDVGGAEDRADEADHAGTVHVGQHQHVSFRDDVQHKVVNGDEMRHVRLEDG